ncbi:MAG: hypothetical protein HRU20_01520 [Pseudomonadales bacterium]|nr:hypothetical protein [Pseudomonadales bacterium]
MRNLVTRASALSQKRRSGTSKEQADTSVKAAALNIGSKGGKTQKTMAGDGAYK